MEIIKHNLIKIIGITRIIKKDISGNIKISEYKNLVTNTGLQLIGDLLDGDVTTGVTYVALGSSVVAPLATDTALGTEIFRKQIALRERSSQTITLSSYLTTSEANGTHKELGHFGNAATSTADSGTLFNHTAINETKDVSVTWTIEQTFTFVNA